MAVEGLRRAAWAEISTTALAHNVRALRSVVGPAQFCAVVKANGYGHGARWVSDAALDAGADSLAVALVDEGIELREAGITSPILLLGEITPEVIGDAFAYSLTLTIGSLAGAWAARREAEARGGVHRVHLKVDTGMHRTGVAPDEVIEVAEILRSCAELELEGLYTHFSVADGSRAPDRTFTREQIALFDNVVAALALRGVTPRLVHCANSAGALGYPESRKSLVRVGLSLYGYLPRAWLGGALDDGGVTLHPAMTLRARVVARRRVGAGQAPSYGRRRPLERESTVVSVPFGYADGYPRRLFDAGAEVLIRGRRYPLAGAVTMDQLVVDVGDDAIEVGEDVVLLGRQGDEVITADEWADWGHTITWEILCGIGARVARVRVD